jgi:hypothetical protein
MLQDLWLLKLFLIQLSFKNIIKKEVWLSSATNQFKIAMLILEKIYTKTLFSLEEILSSKVYQKDFNKS